MEEWKSVPNFETYEVSNLGRVKNTRSGRILKPCCNGKGYLRVMLGSGTGIRTYFKVYELVLLVFVGPRPSGCNINHKNADKSDNSLENLEYVTYRDNSRHASKMGLMNGDKRKSAILNSRDVRVIKSLLSEGNINHREISEIFGVERATISQINRGAIWKWV